MDDLLPFRLAAMALTSTPGPTNLALAATGAGLGTRHTCAGSCAGTAY